MAKLFKKKKKEVEITAIIEKMDCKRPKDDERILVCKIEAKSGDRVIKDTIAINTPRLKYMEIKEEGKKPQYYFKEIEVED